MPTHDSDSSRRSLDASTDWWEHLDPESTALLVIDLQNDFCTPGGFFEEAGHDVSPCTAVVDNVSRLVSHVKAAGIGVVYTMTVRTDVPPQRIRPARHRVRPDEAAVLGVVTSSHPYEPGAWGTQIADALDRAMADIVVEKPRHSAFYDTRLDEWLRERSVDTLLVTGATTNCCVDSTVRDAFMRGYNLVVIADGVAAFGAERSLHDATLRNVELFFGAVTSSDGLIAALYGTARPAQEGS